jgi:hypothetical protein
MGIFEQVRSLVRSLKARKIVPLQYPRVQYRNWQETALQEHGNKSVVAPQVKARSRDATIFENFQNSLIRSTAGCGPFDPSFRPVARIFRTPPGDDLPPIHHHRALHLSMRASAAR